MCQVSSPNQPNLTYYIITVCHIQEASVILTTTEGLNRIHHVIMESNGIFECRCYVNTFTRNPM